MLAMDMLSSPSDSGLNLSRSLVSILCVFLGSCFVAYPPRKDLIVYAVISVRFRVVTTKYFLVLKKNEL